MLTQLVSKFCSSKDIDKSINKLQNTSNEILEVLEDHTSHKDKIKRKYGITKDPTKNELLLVFHYNSNLPESVMCNWGEIRERTCL